MVKKLLWCLPKNKWEPKVTAIEEAQDLKKLKLDDLLGKLLTHEIHLKEEDGESSGKRIALKPQKKIAHRKTEDEDPYSNNDEAFFLIVQGLNKIGLKKRFNQRGFNTKGSTSKRTEKYTTGKFLNKDNTNIGSCYGCGMPSHLLKDQPLIQKMGKKRKLKKKEIKRAMIAAQSDSKTSDSESDEEHTTNTCLMANDVQNDEQSEYESTEEVHISSLYECSKDELIDALISFANLEHKYMSKYKDLKKKLRDLSQKNAGLEKLNNELHGKIKDVEAKNQELSTKCNAKHKTILKFTQGQENLDRLLSTQRASFNKEGIEDDYFNKKKNYKNFFGKPTVYEMNNKTWNYCSKEGHIAYSCPL